MADKRPLILASGGSVQELGTDDLLVAHAGQAGVRIDSSNDNAVLYLDKGATSGKANAINAYTNNSLRWQVFFGDATAESSSATGSNFAILRYSNTGAFLGTPFWIDRQSGQANFGGAVAATSLTTSGGITAGANITTTGDVVTSSALYQNPDTGLRASPTFVSGGGTSVTRLFIYNPNWYDVHGQAYHEHGVWAGFRFITTETGNVKTFEFRNNGSIYANGAALTSDRRLKTELQPIKDAMAKVRKLTGYTYGRPDLANTVEPSPMWGVKRHAGVIYDEVLSVLPEATETDRPSEANPDPYGHVHHAGLIALLIQALNELDVRVAALEGART